MGEPWTRSDGLWFGDAPPLAEPPPFVVGHWTAGEGGPERVYRVLRDRGLSVHFVGGSDGAMVQMADLDRRCAHAGTLGNRGIGVEMVSAGVPGRKHSPRPIVETTVRGRKLKALAFTPDQIPSWVALCERLAEIHGWPRQVPDTDGVLTPAQIKRWRGALEHMHLTARKIDAGGLLCRALVAAGWRAVAP